MCPGFPVKLPLSMIDWAQITQTGQELSQSQLFNELALEIRAHSDKANGPSRVWNESVLMVHMLFICYLAYCMCNDFPLFQFPQNSQSEHQCRDLLPAPSCKVSFHSVCHLFCVAYVVFMRVGERERRRKRRM